MKHLRIFLFSILLLLIGPLSADANFNAAAKEVDAHKDWTIHFNQPITPGTITNNTVYVLDSNKQKVAVTYKVINNNKSFVVEAPSAGYTPGETYTLVVTNGVKNGSKALTTTAKKPFTITKGYVITKANGITLLYTELDLTGNSASYVAARSALDVVDVTEKSIAVQVGQAVRYIDRAGVTFSTDRTKQNYYKVSDGDLLHYVYNHTKNNHELYVASKAPSFLKVGATYTSSDGSTFIDQNGKTVGKSYAYFQYVSPRTKTAYTAAELDRYIEQEMTRRNIPNSQLKGLGTALKRIEATYNVNALFLLAFAANESSFGNSGIAHSHKNLFGINVKDEGNVSKVYATAEESVMDLVTNVLPAYFSAEVNGYANGTAAGNKFVGFNVAYASDPYWGAKIAGFMYTADKALGQKDYKQYDIGFVKATPNNFLRVRQAPVDGAELYRIRNTVGKPVTIKAKQSGWYEIVSDMPSTTYGYASGDYIDVIRTH